MNSQKFLLQASTSLAVLAGVVAPNVAQADTAIAGSTFGAGTGYFEVLGTGVIPTLGSTAYGLNANAGTENVVLGIRAGNAAASLLA